MDAFVLEMPNSVTPKAPRWDHPIHSTCIVEVLSLMQILMANTAVHVLSSR